MKDIHNKGAILISWDVLELCALKVSKIVDNNLCFWNKLLSPIIYSCYISSHRCITKDQQLICTFIQSTKKLMNQFSKGIQQYYSTLHASHLTKADLFILHSFWRSNLPSKVSGVSNSRGSKTFAIYIM